MFKVLKRKNKNTIKRLIRPEVDSCKFWVGVRNWLQHGKARTGDGRMSLDHDHDCKWLLLLRSQKSCQEMTCPFKNTSNWRVKPRAVMSGSVQCNMGYEWTRQFLLEAGTRSNPLRNAAPSACFLRLLSACGEDHKHCPFCSISCSSGPCCLHFSHLRVLSNPTRPSAQLPEEL
jgi:hypothetical protein